LVGKIKKLSDFTPDKVVLENYDPHATIKAELTVAGGYYEGKSRGAGSGSARKKK